MLELELAKVIQENPGLKVFYLFDTEESIEYGYNFLKINKIEIDDIWSFLERLYIGYEYIMDQINYLNGYIEDSKKFEKEVMKKYKSEVRKAILVYLSPAKVSK